MGRHNFNFSTELWIRLIAPKVISGFHYFPKLCNKRINYLFFMIPHSKHFFLRTMDRFPFDESHVNRETVEPCTLCHTFLNFSKIKLKNRKSLRWYKVLDTPHGASQLVISKKSKHMKKICLESTSSKFYEQLFFVQKFHTQLFCSYILGLYFLCAKILAQKMLIKCW